MVEASTKIVLRRNGLGVIHDSEHLRVQQHKNTRVFFDTCTGRNDSDSFGRGYGTRHGEVQSRLYRSLVRCLPEEPSILKWDCHLVIATSRFLDWESGEIGLIQRQGVGISGLVTGFSRMNAQ